MSFDAETLYRLLPAIHRVRDAEQGAPLKDLIAVFAEQLQVLEDDIEQLYDDLFIETCAPWVIPYIGDLIGFRTLHGEVLASGSARAEVAQTIALRRRKGTAAVLEQLARDVTGWDARAVEFFQTLGTTQYMNHIRRDHHYAPDLRHWRALELVGGPFDRIGHTVDVRRIGSARGRHNIPNVGVFLWPIEAQRATRSTAVRVDAQRYRVSPLGHDMPLYNHPLAEDSITHLAEPVNVPLPLSRRVLEADLEAATQPSDPLPSAYYGEERSLALYLNGSTTPVPPSELCICNLSDSGGSWAHLPDTLIAVDPVLGRIALPSAQNPPVSKLEVTHYYGFSADIGGGEYARGLRAGDEAPSSVVRVPEDHSTIQAALDALDASTPGGGDGVVIITDSGRYVEALSLKVRAGKHITLRAPRESSAVRRASLVLTGPLNIVGGADSSFLLEGLLVSGDKLEVPAQPGNLLARLEIAHATLVPGWSLDESGAPREPDEPSLTVAISNTEVRIERSITGGLRVHEGAKLSATDSIIDATALERVAFAAPDGAEAGGSLKLSGCTCVGKLHALELPLVSNCLLLARLADADSWPVAVRAERKQTGCVRFTWLPPDARVPRRFHCLPPPSGTPSPRMLSLRYGTPTYARLSAATDAAILHGADDEGELGAFHHLHASQRETNLRLRLDEYLRAGLEAGVMFET